MSDSKNPSSDPSSQGANSESQIDLSQLDPLHTSTTATSQSTSSDLIDLIGEMSPDPVPLLSPIITDEPLAHLYITGIDTYATVEEFENDTVLKRYKKFCSNLRMQTSKVSGKKRIIISFHNRDAVMEAESDLRKSFPGENVNFKVEYIEQEEPTTLKQEPGPPTQKEREVTQTEAKSRVPIPPATTSKNISAELMIFIKTNFKIHIDNFKLQGTVTYDEDKGTVTIAHPDPQELQRFVMNVFNEIDEVLENLTEEEMKLLNSPVQNYSSCIEMICQTETMPIQYLMNSNPNQIHIFGDKLLVSKAMKKLKQTLSAQLARDAVIEAESDSQRSFPGENLDFKTDYIEREEPTTLKEEPGSPLTQTEAKPTEPIPPATASKNISTELMIFIRTNFKINLEDFKLQGTVTCDEDKGTVTITHPDPQELQRFERNVFNEIDEVLENLNEGEMKLLNSPVQNYSSCIDMICQTESKQIQYLMNNNPNQIHIYGDKLLVSKAMKKLKQTLSAQFTISRPLVFFFKKFPILLHPNINQFHISDLTVNIKGTSSVEQCKEIRDSMQQVVSSCCVKPLNLSQKLLRPAHVFITRNDLCVCLLIQTQEGEFLDKADKAIPGGSIYVCGLREHIDPLIPVLENPIEERLSISQKALTKLTKTTDREDTNLLEKIKAKSKVSISLDEQNVIVTGFIYDNINATVEELKKKFEDVNIVLDERYLDPLQKSYLLDQRTEFKSQIIQNLESSFQLKVEVQGDRICLSGDQDSLRNLEANPRKLAEFFEHRIPIRTICREVEERSAQLFAGLIFRYLGDLSSQEHFFLFLIDKKRMQMKIRPGICEIPISITAADSIIVSIESRIKELRPNCEIVKLKREDLNVVLSTASNKIKQIEASEYLRIIPDSQAQCKLQVFSIGQSSRTAQKMIDFALSDQFYSRHLPITSMLAFYIQEKKLISIFTKKWQCNMKIIEVKENEEFITHCQIDGKRESLEKLANHVTTMNKELTSISVEVNYPAKKFCSQFHAEILEVLTAIKGESNVVIDTRSIAGKDPTSIGKAKVNFISTTNSDINNLSNKFSDLIKFSQTTPVPLLPAQHEKLRSDMLPTLTSLSQNRHYYIDLNRDNVSIKAINYFASNALPCGEHDLQPYLEISSCEYRADNLVIFNLLNNPTSRGKLNTLGVGNSVNIKPPASLEQPFKLEGKHVNVQTVLAEIKKHVQELWQYLGTCEVSVHCPLSAIQADPEIIKFLSVLSHQCNVQYEFPSQVGEGLIASYEVALKTHNLSIDLRKGDITKLKVDAIVNAANDNLDHCGGVALAISDAGGPIVQQSSTEHVKRQGKVPVSQNVILSPGNLPCQSVIHAVGPIWDPMNQNKVKNELGQCVFNICQQAAGANFSSIAIPTISAGIYGFPLQLSTSIIIEAIDHFFSTQSNHSLRKLILIDIQDEAIIQFQKVFNQNPKFRSCPIPKKALSSTPQITFEWQGHDDQWRPFSEMDYNKIRTAYSANPKGTAKTSRGKHTYTVDFSESIETNDQTQAKKKIRINVPVPTTESVPEDDDSPPASWKTIASEKVEFFGPKTILDSIKQKFTVLTQKLVSKTEFPVTCRMKDLIRIIDSCKTDYIKFDLTKSDDGNIKVLIEGFAREVTESEKNITAELMKLLMADLAQDQRLEPTPKDWDPHTANEMCKLVRLQPTSPEYLEVVKAFQSTLPTAAIVKIERIQNTWLWTRYQQDTQRIVQKSSTGANELILFHGTRTTDPKLVYNGAQGFDFRFSNPGMWGCANYFAVNASYSNGYAHTLGDRSKQMFSVRICAGDVIDLPSDSSLRLPPPKPQAPQVFLPTPIAPIPASPTTQAAVAPQFANDPYDTVSGFTNGSKVYMIYENGRAYPEYLITYR